MKAWWLGFPKFRCPHCGTYITGVKFVGHFKLPRAKKLAKDLGESLGNEIAEKVLRKTESKREEVREP